MLSLYGEVYFRAWRVASGPYLKVVFFSAILLNLWFNLETKIWTYFFLQIYFDLSLSINFSCLPFFSISSFVAHVIVVLLHGIVAG